jgi:trehalose 2-sulfotransferase
MQPTLSYLICTTPRSGSTLLCEALENTGIAGRPEEYYQHRRKTGLPRRPREYFEDGLPLEVADVLGRGSRVDHELEEFDPRRFPSYRAYLDWTIERGMTPNGVFGAKVMWGYFNGFVDRLRDVHGDAIMPTRTVLERTFGDLHWIFLTRRDKLRQAVSLWKALQNWTWRSEAGNGQGSAHDLRYSYAGIDHLVRQLREHERHWAIFFSDHGLFPQTIVYEEVASDYEGTARAVLQQLGLELPDLSFPHRRMQRQSDGLSEEWVERYREDARRPAAPVTSHLHS